MKNLERRFLLVDVSVLPEVFLKVLKAKELLAAGNAKNVSAATKMAGLSRSAFYKYKDCIFDAENSKEVLTVNATLLGFLILVLMEEMGFRLYFTENSSSSTSSLV